MGTEGFAWTWSPPHGDYYFVTTDPYGTLTYHWYKQNQQVTVPVQSLSPRSDSWGERSFSFSVEATSSESGVPEIAKPHIPEPAEPVAPEVRFQIRDFIAGTPEKGWYEQLDSSYRMRTGAEAVSFFRLGKVFSMLHIQAASRHALQESDSVTVVKYGEHAFSQIRRFVVVNVRRGFVYACPITTYSGRATLGPDCVPSEHSVVYLRGEQPALLQGEHLQKEPICIVPAQPEIHMEVTSRLHFGKAYPVEMNVKVKDIGDVEPGHISNLLRYYKEESRFE